MKNTTFGKTARKFRRCGTLMHAAISSNLIGDGDGKRHKYIAVEADIPLESKNRLYKHFQDCFKATAADTPMDWDSIVSTPKGYLVFA